MKIYDSNSLRNVAVLGHSGCGKSNLIEAIQYTASLTNKIPKVSDKIQMTHNMSLIPVEYNQHKYNLLDTPGYFDFEGEVISALKASDVALIVIDATSPIQVGTEKAIEITEDNIPRIIFINKIDHDKARYKELIGELREAFDNKVVPMLMPIYKDKKFVKLHNVFENIDCLDGEFQEEAMHVKETLMELIAETDDDILDKYFNGEELSPEDISKGITIGIQNGDIIPAICGSTVNNIGTSDILDTIATYVKPNNINSEDKFKGVIFKTTVDPFIGKMSYVKVLQGSIKKDSEVFHLNKSNKEKISNVYTIRKNELIEVERANAGDIIVLTKLNSLRTGDTLAQNKDEDLADIIDFPSPQIYYALIPKNKGDEDKISNALNKVVEEDPTLKWHRNTETKQALLGGQGELHVNTVRNKIKEKFGVDTDLEDIKVAYRETIKSKSDVQGKHKKQSGGHGQYGDVKIRFEPSDKDFEFEEDIFGGSVPKQYIPAVERGLRDSMIKGVLAGYPVTNIKAILYDGSYHDVDSSEMAFKMAASIAFKKGMEEAKPVLVEPIMKMKIVVPEDYMGDIMGDLNKRRGKILGMESDDRGKQIIYANAPQSETFKYAIDLRAMTQGRGHFEMNIETYEEVPTHISQKIVSKIKK